jgi:hypothetical protein
VAPPLDIIAPQPHRRVQPLPTGTQTGRRSF